MVGRVLRAMSKEIRGLHEAAYVLALFTFLAQILALLRDRAFAHLIGPGVELDAYFAAFRIPDLTFAVLTLFVSSFALIPLLEKRGGVTTPDARSLIGSVLLVFGVASVALASVLFVMVPQLAVWLFPGFDTSTQEVVTTLSRIMLLQPILLGISSIVGSVVQASRRFVLYALAPIVYNVGIIVGALVWYPLYGVVGLAWGVVLGAVLHGVVQCIPFIFFRMSPAPQVATRIGNDIREVVSLSLPRALALGAHQIVLVAFVSVASLSVAGSISVMMFGFNLQSVPLAIIGVSYASALFPSLAALFQKGDRETFTKETWVAIRHIVLWTTLAIALMVVLRAHLVRVLLGTGAFTWNDTRLTAAILAAFVISLVAQGAMLIFSRAFYAAERQREPIILNVGAALLSSAIAYSAFTWFQQATTARFFVEGLFRIGDIPGTEVVMVALSYSAVMLLTSLLFGFMFGKRFGFERGVIRSLFFSSSAAVLAGASTYVALQWFGPLLPTDTFLGIFAQGVAAAMVGGVMWIGVLYAMKSPEFSEIETVLSRLIARRNPPSV